MKTFDVVIIGAGLAGLQCARLLSGRGIGVLLVDRKNDLATGIHTTGIFVRKTIEDFAFPAGTLGRPIRNVTLYSPKLKALELESEKEEFRVGKMEKLYESLLQDCLDNGVEFASGTRFVSAKASKGATSIALEKKGVAAEVTAKVLIGADGANSNVARSLGLDENREWIVGYEEVFHIKDRSGIEPRLHCFLDSRLAPGYLAWIADDGEDVHVGVGGYAASFRPREALDKLKKKIPSDICDLNSADLIETRGGRIPVGGILKNIANENGLLIGDAAGAVSPLTAGGLDPALRLSAFAAEIVEARIKDEDPSVLLKFSGDLFRSRFISRRWMRRAISVFTNQTLLELLCLFLRGSIGKRLAKHIFFGRGSFPGVETARTGRRTAGTPIL